MVQPTLCLFSCLRAKMCSWIIEQVPYYGIFFYPFVMEYHMSFSWFLNLLFNNIICWKSPVLTCRSWSLMSCDKIGKSSSEQFKVFKNESKSCSIAYRCIKWFKNRLYIWAIKWFYGFNSVWLKHSMCYYIHKIYVFFIEWLKWNFIQKCTDIRMH